MKTGKVVYIDPAGVRAARSAFNTNRPGCRLDAKGMEQALGVRILPALNR